MKEAVKMMPDVMLGHQCFHPFQMPFSSRYWMPPLKTKARDWGVAQREELLSSMCKAIGSSKPTGQGAKQELL